MDREARLRLTQGLAAATLPPLALGACATASPQALRLEDRPAENVVRIVNPTSRPVRLYVSDVDGWRRDFQLFHVRYRDGRSRQVAFDYERVDHWWTPLIHSSNIYPVGRAPAWRLTLGPGQSRDYSRSELFAWLGNWRREHPPVEGPCAVQLRVFGRLHPRGSDYVEILGDWQPAACPDPVRPASSF